MTDRLRRRPLRCGCGWLARAALMWERVWPAAAGRLSARRRFPVLALFDVLPQSARRCVACRAVLVAFGARRSSAGWRTALRRTSWPDDDAARRRIEQSSGLAHRPLQALADRPSAPLDRDAHGAVAGASAAHGGGDAAVAGRLAGAGLGAARPVGAALGAGDPAADRRDRCRHRLARADRRALAPELRRRTGGGRDQLRYLGDAAGIYRAARRNSCAPATRRPVQVPTGSTLLGAGAWRRDRRRAWRSMPKAAISRRSTNRTSGPLRH